MSKEKTGPMDPSLREDVVGAPAVNSQRVCWAAKTLVAEVEELFPETPVEYSNHDGRNTALDVTFDLTTLDKNERADLVALLSLFDLDADPRIDAIIVGGGHMADQVLVSFHANPRTQDSRAPFGLGDALDVLSDIADGEVLDLTGGAL